MDNVKNTKKVYDLEDRTLIFAKNVRLFIKTLPKTIANIEDSKQVVRASGSVGANYREAKESGYWLRLINETNDLENSNSALELIQEATELKKILSAILEKSK